VGRDVPRWLVLFGLTAGMTLLVALLRYAIDLLGVVFVIILVGFALRAVSDWLTEGESVSAWALSALSLGLTGTLVVGLWLFNSRELTGRVIQLPGSVQRTVTWLEAKGWGQRVLLPGGATSSALAGGLQPGEAPQAPAVPATPSAPAPRTATEVPMPEMPATLASSPSKRADADAGAASETAALAMAAPLAAPRMPTRVALSVSPRAAVVGRSVRLTAIVRAGDGAAVGGGSVVFLAGDVPLGRTPVRNGVAELVTLDLALGDHRLTASYDGDRTHLPSQSPPVIQSVTRR
jgi:Bacterial Ig-like domain (group 3)